MKLRTSLILACGMAYATQSSAGFGRKHRKDSMFQKMAMAAGHAAFNIYRAQGQHGRMSPQQLHHMGLQVQHVQSWRDQKPANKARYNQVIYNPGLAASHLEEIMVLESRDYYVCVDGSGGMNSQETYSYGRLWDSARHVTTTVTEAAAYLDRDGAELELWSSMTTPGHNPFAAGGHNPFAAGGHNPFANGMMPSHPHSNLPTRVSMYNKDQVVQNFFSQNSHRLNGELPISRSLDHLYRRPGGIKSKINVPDPKPVSVVIIIGSQISQTEMPHLFTVIQSIVTESRLYEPGRDKLLGISFVQVGDNISLSQNLEALDNGIQGYLNGVDIIDFKKDEDVFHNGPYALFMQGLVD